MSLTAIRRYLADWHIVKVLGPHGRRWRDMYFSSPRSDGAHVFYGRERVPGPDEYAHGGMVKVQRMQADFPNTPRGFNLAYLVSSALPGDWREIFWILQRKRIPLIWNQNGVGYPAWCGEVQEKINAPLKTGLHLASHVFYQSEFCRRCADHFLGPAECPHEVLHNAVDTAVFTPATEDPDPDHLVLLLGGNQFARARVFAALHTLAELKERIPEARLIITGRIEWEAEEGDAASETRDAIRKLDLEGSVELTGPYEQAHAPALLRRGHILLHTKVCDPCPGLVLEAMACGLPVVYSDSGGTPELVGPDAGIGVEAEWDWNTLTPPDPGALAQAITRIATERHTYSAAARQRAVDSFNQENWMQRHRDVFEKALT